MYSNVLDTLEHGPLKGMCSPSIMGSSGVVPLTVISLYVPDFRCPPHALTSGTRIPDIMRYYKDLIINAQHEVFLATNYWEPSWGAHL